MRPENDLLRSDGDAWDIRRSVAGLIALYATPIDPFAMHAIRIRSDRHVLTAIVRMRSRIYNDRRTALLDLKNDQNFDVDFLVSISFFHNMVRCRTNTVVMYVKRGFSTCLLFVKTNYYSNKQLIVHGNVYHNILFMKNEIVCNQYV